MSARHPTDDSGFQTVLDQSQPRRRRRAASILLPDDGQRRPHRASQHERAFRIAYAVFRQQPLHYVFDAAAWLLEEIDSAALRSDWGSMALEHPVQDLLGPELKNDWLAGRDAGNAASGASRVAWIRDSGLRGAILDVAWHDFDSTRKSLLKWIDRMARDKDPIVSRAGAETAALLIHHDFERMHRDLIDVWASDRSPRVRQAAASAEAIAEPVGDVQPLLRARLRQWCYEGNNYQRDTAARLYASGVQQLRPSWSVADLRRIAKDPLQRRSPAVAEAVNQLYRPELAAQLIRDLAVWTTETNLRTHAARALLTLADRPADGEADGRPELLVRSSEGAVATEDLVRLWRAGILDPALSGWAWAVLGRWLRQADSDDLLREQLQHLIRQMFDRPAMRRRALFYLGRRAEFKEGLPQWIAQNLA